ncbi:MAG: helix-turn-helix transcriptional regulator [Chloroflexi bacterium]|nr:helix-turn-helix transcriptional regulator [Chloroflexota bacterium]
MKHTDYLAKIEDYPEYLQGLADLKTHFALGDAILRARIKKGLSQADLAKMAGTKQANISRLESALGNPTLKLVNKILQALELDVNFVSPISTNSYKSIPFKPGIRVDNWPTSVKTNSLSSQSTGKLS